MSSQYSLCRIAAAVGAFALVALAGCSSAESVDSASSTPTVSSPAEPPSGAPAPQTQSPVVSDDPTVADPPPVDGGDPVSPTGTAEATEADVGPAHVGPADGSADAAAPVPVAAAPPAGQDIAGDAGDFGSLDALPMPTLVGKKVSEIADTLAGADIRFTDPDGNPVGASPGQQICRQQPDPGADAGAQPVVLAIAEAC